jgi:hypothetical protein
MLHEQAYIVIAIMIYTICCIFSSVRLERHLSFTSTDASMTDVM